MNDSYKLLDLFDEIRAIGQMGLFYTRDTYDKVRYNRLVELSSQKYSDISGITAEEIKQRFINELGYITPKLGVI